MLRITLVLSAVLALAIPAQCGTVVFDFDNNNSPILSPYGSLPIYQTVGGVTAKFDGNLSLQDARMVGMNYVTNTVTNVSCYFLFPGGGDSALSIEFSYLLTAISFNFATNDISQNGNSRLRMLLYNGSTPVGLPYTDAVGSGESTWSMGTLQFTSTAGSFNRVNIDILPGQGLGSTFTADNFGVTLDQSAPPRPNIPADPNVPEPAGMAVIGLGFIAFAGLRIRTRH
jgi:hypothetical protein